MLSNTLNTNEIKDSAGVEVEMTHIRQTDRERNFAKIAETPSLPYRLSIKHQETGIGMKLRRRSLVRIDKTVISGVDSVTPITVSAYVVVDLPVGAMSANTESKHVLANLLSFCATTGAATTVLFDCTGNGAAALIDGSL